MQLGPRRSALCLRCPHAFTTSGFYISEKWVCISCLPLSSQEILKGESTKTQVWPESERRMIQRERPCKKRATELLNIWQMCVWLQDIFLVQLAVKANILDTPVCIQTHTPKDTCTETFISWIHKWLRSASPQYSTDCVCVFVCVHSLICKSVYSTDFILHSPSL